jgi:hypothetical protein
MSKDNKILNPNRFTRVNVSTGRVEFRAVVENDVTVEDIKDANFWSLVAIQFTTAGILPRIEIVPDDVSWLIDAVVVQSSKGHAVLKILNGPVDLSGAAENGVQSEDGLRVTYGGPHAKHRVVNGNGQVIKEGMTKQEAELFLDNHRKVVG